MLGNLKRAVPSIAPARGILGHECLAALTAAKTEGADTKGKYRLIESV